MGISEIKSGTRLPFAYLQFDSSLASASLKAVQPFRCLLMGDALSSNQNMNKQVRLLSEKDASESFGEGSMLHKMVKIYFQNSDIEVWGIALSSSAVLSEDAKQAIKGMQFNVIASGYSSKEFLASLATELKERSHATRAAEGFAFACIPGHLNLDAFALLDGINSPHLSVMATSSSTSEPYELAAALAGVVATSAQEDPARPFRTLELSGIHAPSLDQVEPREVRETALHSGFST